MAEEGAAGYLAGRIDALRENLVSLAAALPGLPAELARMRELLAGEWEARGPGGTLALIAGFLLLGFAVEWVYRYSTPRGDVSKRLRAIGLRVARDAGAVAAFAFGSAAVFLAFEWPPRTREAVVGFLVAFILLRITITASRTLLSPRDAPLRILPADDATAEFWHRRIVLFASWFAFGWVVRGWLLLLGMEPAALRLVVLTLGLGLLAILVEAFWRRSRLSAVYFVALWLIWVTAAFGLMWLALIVAALPVAMRLAQQGVDHVLRPEGAAVAGARSVAAAAIGRALRALLVTGAALLLVHAFGLDVDALAATDSMWMRLVRGAVHALVIVLVADVLWLVIASLIDQKLASADEEGNTRLRTLLPILRGTMAIVLIVMTVLMALSALGVEVGPLLASAGVVGLALGFGAQTLVRDLFSKFFYLLDDAFRVGEYIQSGSYKGTVEHLGARSIRLRHHRGPVYTIPYGELGAVQNQSRDWVIDKLTIGLAYDSDLDKAKKLIKKIGQELAQNPEFAPNILEPLKMQGVEQFGDFAIQIRMKMKTKPGQQFTIRRKAYAMIKAAFAANGIKFAQPTVQVAGGGDVAAAAARQALELNKAPTSG
ncbi:MAG TPA: mechanosensitive ion channel family protein [Burkholderiales bacterium]|nr:mechanosensitive ion channel family protein [Burkholderiales bacterium]